MDFRIAIHSQKVIILLSSCVALALFSLGAFTNVGDSHQFLYFANDIVHFWGPTRADRLCGYPILIILSLYFITHSLFGLYFIQVLMGVAITWFIYKIGAFFSKKFAFVVSFFSIFSLLPYNYQNLLYHDQLILFLLILFSYGMLAVKEKVTYKNISFLSIACGLLTFLRPTFGVLFFTLMVYLLIILLENKKRLSYLKLASGILGSFFILHVGTEAVYHYFYNHTRNTKTESITSIGAQVFFNVYRLNNRIQDSFSMGEYTAYFRKILTNHFHSSKNNYSDFVYFLPTYPEDQYDLYFSKYRNQPDQLVESLFANPTTKNYWYLHSLIYTKLYDRPGDWLLLKMSLEQYYYHPRLLLVVFFNGVKGYLFDVPNDVNLYLHNFYEKIPSRTIVKDENYYHDAYFKETYYTLPILSHVINLQHYSIYVLKLMDLWSLGYKSLFKMVSIGAVLGFFFSMIAVTVNSFVLKKKSSKETFFIFTIGVIYLSYIIPMIMLVDSQFRYQSSALLLLFLMFSITVKRISLMLNQLILLIRKKFILISIKN